MAAEWKETKLIDFMDFNPVLSIKKNSKAKKVPMEMLLPFTRKINGYEVTEYKGGSKFQNGDTLLARITPCLENGKTAFVSILEEGETAFGSTEFIVLRAKKNVSDPFFIYYLMRSPFIREIAIKSMSGSSGRQRVQQNVLEDLKVILPPLEEQQKIVKILSSLDEKIELNNKINENLHAQAQAIFKSWFVDFEPFGGTMPSDWEKGKLSDVADIIMGQSPKGESYNEIGDGEIFYQGKADFTEKFPVRRLYTTEPKRMAEEKSVLLSVRAPVGEINVAMEKCCIGRGLASIKSKKGQNSYLLYLLYSIQSQFDIFNGEGTVFGSINKSDLGNMNIVLPAQEKISQFEKIVSQLDEMILTNWNENQKLAQIRDTLLPKLMNGELEV